MNYPDLRHHQNNDNFAMYNSGGGYSNAPTTLLHSNTATISSMGAGYNNKSNNGSSSKKRLNQQQHESFEQQYHQRLGGNKKLDSYMDSNRPNTTTTIETSAAGGIRGSGESLANLSMSSPIGFSDTSEASAAVLGIKNGGKLRKEFENVFNPMTAGSSSVEQQFHRQLSVNNKNQRRRTQKTENEFNVPYSKEDLTRQQLFSAAHDVFTKHSPMGTQAQRQMFNESYTERNALMPSTLSNLPTKSSDFANVNFALMQNQRSLMKNDGTFKYADVLTMNNNNKENIVNPHHHINYSALLTTPISDDTGDEVKNFRSEHADSSRHGNLLFFKIKFFKMF